MMTGAVLILVGLVILLYPQVLIVMIAGFFMAAGLSIMAVSWKFRRLRRQANSQVMNWILRW